MIRKKRDEKGAHRVFEGLSEDASPADKLRFKREAKAAIFKMSRDAAELLAENSAPFAVVVVDGDNETVQIGMAGSEEDAHHLLHAIEHAKRELVNNIVAAKLGLRPEKVNMLREILGED